MNLSDSKTTINLVPDKINESPDYFCTWQAQLYCTNDGGPQAQRDSMTEENVFGKNSGSTPKEREENDLKSGIGWASHLYKKARRDLIYLMDDCWDIPIGAEIGKSPWYGSQILARDKFPSFFGEGGDFDPERNVAAMKKLSEAVKSLGWRGIGGWICIQKSPLAPEKTDEDYWRERIKWTNAAGWLYWKVDWGTDYKNYKVRRLMTELRLEYAPDLIVEHALVPEMIPYADSYRTYDVFTLLAIPITLSKLEEDFRFDAAPGHLGLINCMDEVYIAAALGCAIDVTRHTMTGNLPDGRPDPSFPALHRNLKTKTTEVLRTVRWHRVAPAFSVNGSETFIDPEKFTDTWDVVDQKREIEAWWKYTDGDHIERTGPARISRGMPPAKAAPSDIAMPDNVTPKVTYENLGEFTPGNYADPDIVKLKEPLLPFIVSAKHPCGAVSVATLARTKSRECFTPLCDVELEIGGADTLGVFGYYNSLTLTGETTPEMKILMQDSAADESFDVTKFCVICENRITIPGSLINTLGRLENPPGDTSEPGVIVKISGIS